GQEFDRRPEHAKPSRVIMLIATDGHENASTEYTRAIVRERVERQRCQWQWEFVFLGANIDAFAEGGNLGFDPSNIAQYVPKGANVRNAFAGMNLSVSNYRAGGSARLDASEY
ncbi:MAG: VWA domain-containing protein, partial [Phycisphaerae bacterium]|nr:VWA domain-containing protein [Phycisphaerae bacterium]